MSWVALGSAAVTAGAGYMSSRQAAKGAGGGGLMEWTAPQYSFTEPRLQQTSDYISNTMSRLGRGEAPAYYERAVPKIRERAMNNLYQNYFGNQGNRRGAYNMALESGAVQGVGPRAGFNRAQGMMNEYTNQAQQIDQFLEQEGLNIMKQESLEMPRLSMQMPGGPESQAMPYQQPDAGSNGWDLLGNLAGQVPWESMLGGGAPKFNMSKAITHYQQPGQNRFAPVTPNFPKNSAGLTFLR